VARCSTGTRVVVWENDSGTLVPLLREGLRQGVRMRAFEGPEEFLLSLRSAQVLRRPRSLLYLQSLKWMAQAKERVR